MLLWLLVVAQHHLLAAHGKIHLGWVAHALNFSAGVQHDAAQGEVSVTVNSSCGFNSAWDSTRALCKISLIKPIPSIHAASCPWGSGTNSTRKSQVSVLGMELNLALVFRFLGSGQG